MENGRGAARPKAGDTGSRAATRPSRFPVRVLLVDDQRIVGEAVRRMLLPHEDIAFHHVVDPTDALEAAGAFYPTVILSDLVMPQMDGLELVRRFRASETTCQVPLIVLSSREEAPTKAEAFRLGANDYLVKLPDPIELIARIRYHAGGYTHLLERDEAYRALETSQQRLHEDLAQAARYVESLLPEPEHSRVQADWRFIPSASLGGDTFGYHWHDEDRFAFYLLDVSGHGVGAALLSVSALNVLRSESLPHTDFADPGQVLSRLGRSFRMEEQSGKYFTIWYGIYDARTRRLAWAGGGHPPALLLPPAGVREPARPLPSTGPMPGILPGLTFETKTVELDPKARLLLFSDGIYEIARPDGTMGDHAEFRAAVDGLDAGAADLLDELLVWAHAQAGETFVDDVSIVALTFP
ncbi:MAG: SpoIIE family protein phosphatase [Planctomycetota bacterium]